MSSEIELDQYRERDLGTLGARAFSREVPPAIRENYEGLRRQAWNEVDQRKSCMRRAHEAYESGDGAAAKELSNEGKWHAAQADELFRKASQAAFAANNPNRNSTIDLHGQLVADARGLVEHRIHEDQKEGKTYLHVIVGKGNHSADHVQKLKPAIEDLCRNLGLQYATEENEGRIYVDLRSKATHMPPPQHDTHESHPPQHYGDQQPQHYPGHQQEQYHGGQSQEEQYDEIEKFLTKLFKKYCCTVM
ncbi:hypothetical protein GQX73_g145 [Xylaria multiplex]|uniref:Smr domain-containing protein n=1 Tax=Xylaria multiplex TaxID=323545 RepID=A0A7C8NEA1_9PEZI|nr:hypothetical protein GQX73_g145 [Xylaria multiplex]